MKNNKLVSLSAIFAICFSITSCGNNNSNTNSSKNVTVLNVYNCADYICETNEEEGTVSVLTQFEQYCKNVLNKNVKVEYSTYETNEDLFNQLKAGGVTYDLVCPSEYMIDKLIQNDMLEKVNRSFENYDNYGSPYIKNVFDELTTKNNVTNETVKFKEYAVPYMWGTVGFMYDPSKISFDEVSSWDIIWDTNHAKQTSLKDSIRDTYITSTLHIFKEELLFAKEMYERNSITKEEYNQIITNVMNRCDDKTISLVEADLKKAKENIYEFEVDTGKENIIKGNYYVNLCWSGDAVYSLDLAEEEDFILNYTIPEEGSNIWFDGWVMPKGANVELAQELMNFLCDPDIASQNMNAIGYTSAIAGQDIWNLVQDWYEADDIEDTTEYDLSYFFQGTNVVDEEGNPIDSFIIHTSEVNRQLYAQYPDENTISRLAVMKDFGEQNNKVTEMWIRVKGNNISWVMFVFLGGVVALIVFFEVKRFQSKRARKRRNLNK